MKSSGNKFFSFNLIKVIVLSITFLATFIAYLPGFMSPDSIDQYTQSITGNYKDWHPPAMAILWSLLNRFYNGPVSMLFFQLFLFWCSIYFLSRISDSRRWFAILLVFSFMPFVQNFIGYIIKDVQMVFSLLLAFAIICNALLLRRTAYLYEIIISGLLLIYGGCVRPNAVSALLPLSFLWACTFPITKQVLHKVIIAIAFLFVVLIIQNVIIPVVIKPEKSYSEVKLYLHDITSIYINTGEKFYPDFLNEGDYFDVDTTAAYYHVATFDKAWWMKKGILTDDIRLGDSRVKQLQKLWFKAIRKYPFVYLKARLEGALYFLRLKNRSDEFYFFFPWIHPNKYGFTYERNFLSNILLDWVEVHRKMPYMKPWFWIIINLILIPFIWLVNDKKIRLCSLSLLISSLLYFLPQVLLFQTDTDFRYFYWNCIACSIAVILPFTKLKTTKPKADNS